MKKQKNFRRFALTAGVASALAMSIVPIYAEGDNPPAMPGGQDSSNGQGGPGGAPGNPPSGGMGGGADTQSYDYSGTLNGALSADGKEVSSTGETIEAAESDQNVLLSNNGGTLNVENAQLNKSGSDDNGDNCNFYGINSISLTVGEGSQTNISNSTLKADSSGSNGIFATDSGTAYAENDVIETSADNSRGLDATYDGTIIADKLQINTAGDHSAAIATDRGGGNISVTNSTLNTAGSGSPLLYSTGNIQVDNVTGEASGSQIAGMEGLNRILIYNSTLSSTMTQATASDPIADGVIIYQSTSGDAETSTDETAVFNVSNSTLKSAIESGSMFYVTNTKANIVLSNTTLDFDSSKANLLQIEGNDSNNWGTAGSNGGTVTFTGLGETLTGNISVDTISSLDAYFLDGTTYTGTISIVTNSVNTNANDEPVSVSVDGTSKWVVTGDTTISNLHAAEGAEIVDSEGKTVTIVNNGKTVVQGDSSITVTVTGTYDTEVTTSDANALSTDYIDRTDFDNTYSLSTTFGTNASGAVPTTAAATASTTSEKADTEETAEDTEKSDNTVTFVLIGCAAVIVIGGIAFLSHKKKAEKK